MSYDHHALQLLADLKRPHRNLMELGKFLLQALLKAADNEQPVLFACLLENFCVDDLIFEGVATGEENCLTGDGVEEELLIFCRNFLDKVYTKIDRSLSAKEVAEKVWPKLKILGSDNFEFFSLLLILFLTESSFCPWLSWPKIGHILNEKKFEQVEAKLRGYLHVLFDIVVQPFISPLEKVTRIVALLDQQGFSVEEKTVLMTYFVKYMHRPKDFLAQDIKMQGVLALSISGFYSFIPASIFIPPVKNN